MQLLAKKYNKDKFLCLIKDDDSRYEKVGRDVIKKLGIATKIVDIDSGLGLKDLPRNITHVFHLAARTDTSQKGHNATNYLGTKRLVEALNLTPKTHFVHISTTAFMSGRKDCSKPFREKDSPFPTNEYGRSKLNGEKYLIRKSKVVDFKLTIVRFPTVYGPKPRNNSFFDILNKQIDKDSIISRINWPGLTSLVHVDDAAKIILKLAQNPPKPRQSNVFIVSAESLSLARINSKLFAQKNKAYKQIKLPAIVWKLFRHSRSVLYKLEKLFPAKLYNLFWRASLVVDNVIYCESTKLKEVLPKYRFKTIDKSIEDVTILN